MLHKLKELEDFEVHATDGDIGHTTEFYFDDKQWVIRYLVAETGSWLESRKVLISPISIKNLNQKEKKLTVAISREQLKNSPNIDTQQPVSRQHEVNYLGYYGYPPYWGNVGLWGGYPSPYMIAPGYRGMAPQPDEEIDDPVRKNDQDHHLRSSSAVSDYHLETNDGDLGHLQGMLIDTDTWAIRYLIINTSNWWLGHLVLIAPQWIKEVSWANAKIYADMTQQQIKDAPVYDPDIPLSREYETKIFLHYGRNAYWSKREEALV
ncbi:MAG: hypothetical protein ACI9LY_000080 [Arenicella sp.]|jgi:hypothetical protein